MARRLFLAVNISDTAHIVASNAVRELKKEHPGRGISWVKPENLHVTVKFLGDTEDQTEEKLLERLKRVASDFEPFRLRLDGPEVLGKRVISIRVASDAPTVFELVQRLDSECETLGFKREGRRFHPHLTLGRIRDPHNAYLVTKAFCDAQIEPVAFDVREMVLYESKLTSAGSVYSGLEKFALRSST